MDSNFGKKGNVQEIIFIASLVLTLGITIFVAMFLLTNFNTKLQAKTDVPTLAKTTTDSITQKAPSILDAMFLLIIIIVYIATLISSWFIDTTPAFFVLSVIVLLIALVVVAVIGNANEEILTDPHFNTISPDFPVMMFFAQNLFKIVTAMGILLLITLYAKSRSVTA